MAAMKQLHGPLPITAAGFAMGLIYSRFVYPMVSRSLRKLMLQLPAEVTIPELHPIKLVRSAVKNHGCDICRTMGHNLTMRDATADYDVCASCVNKHLKRGWLHSLIVSLI